MPDRSPSFVLEQLAGQPLVYPVPATEPLRFTFTYRSLPNRQLQADLYCPEETAENSPRLAVVMVHGGPVSKQASPKDWRVFRDYAKLLAAIGVITVVFNHRLHGTSEYFTAQGDLIALLDYLRVHAASYNLDADRLLLWAFDGSGPLLTVALDPRRSYICGSIAYYCSLDLVAAGNASAGASRQVLESLSPVTQLRRVGCRIPILLVRVGRDSTFLNHGTATFLEAAFKCEARIDVFNHPSGVPSFDVCNDDARSREIIGSTLEFVRARASLA